MDVENDVVFGVVDHEHMCEVLGSSVFPLCR